MRGYKWKLSLEVFWIFHSLFYRLCLDMIAAGLNPDGWGRTEQAQCQTHCLRRANKFMQQWHIIISWKITELSCSFPRDQMWPHCLKALLHNTHTSQKPLQKPRDSLFVWNFLTHIFTAKCCWQRIPFFLTYMRDPGQFRLGNIASQSHTDQRHLLTDTDALLCVNVESHTRRLLQRQACTSLKTCSSL